ncbi:MAG: sensor histidine kinase [Muricoprocola sp.]
MRSANSELITAMSHDLRTPLTSLLAFLEIIERKKYKDEQQMDELIHKSVGQTMRIKQMADKLFSYFLAYSTEWEAVDMETMDADQLFRQILGDYAYALESKGMCVKTDFAQVCANISINTELLQRTLDNLYSNLLKYADPKEITWISYKQQEKDILLSISNGIRTEQVKTNSTNLGLVTCRRIIEYHKGHFATDEKDNHFHVTISIPIQS